MFRSVLGLAALLAASAAPASAADKPNVVIVLADDLGYGDLSCYNPERGKISTPNIDALAIGGIRFTDAHSSSGVCSPTRYTLLTGRYHWRTRLQSGIVGVWGAPLDRPGPAHRRGPREAARLPHGLRREVAPRLGLAHRRRRQEALSGVGRAGRRGREGEDGSDRGTGRGVEEGVRAADSRWPDRTRVRRVFRHRRPELAAVLLHRERPHRRHPLHPPAGGRFCEESGQSARPGAPGVEARRDPPGARGPGVRRHREAGQGEVAVPPVPPADGPAHAPRRREGVAGEEFAEAPLRRLRDADRRRRRSRAGGDQGGGHRGEHACHLHQRQWLCPVHRREGTGVARALPEWAAARGTRPTPGRAVTASRSSCAAPAS